MVDDSLLLYSSVVAVVYFFLFVIETTYHESKAVQMEIDRYLFKSLQ